MLVSRLKDGRLVWLSDKPLVLEDGAWVPPKGVTFGMVTDSKPLTDAEISDLRASGILPQ